MSMKQKQLAQTIAMIAAIAVAMFLLFWAPLELGAQSPTATLTPVEPTATTQPTPTNTRRPTMTPTMIVISPLATPKVYMPIVSKP